MLLGFAVEVPVENCSHLRALNMSSGWTECTVVNPEWFDLGRRRRRWMARAVVMNVAARARPLNQVARARHGAAAAAGATASLEIKVRRSADTSQSSL
uniref:Uncharacterized protein n=1 Tax=Mesocestoides corti TaxID=53468 RepID=A0A5K3FNI9_MESCO